MVDQLSDEDNALEDFIFELDDLARRNRVAETLRMAQAFRIASLNGKKGVAEYKKWVRLMERELKPRPKRTVWDRIRDQKGEAPRTPTIWDNMKGGGRI